MKQSASIERLTIEDLGLIERCLRKYAIEDTKMSFQAFDDLIDKIEFARHIQQAEQFIEDLKDAYPIPDDDDEQEDYDVKINEFYDTDFIVRFGNLKVVMHNNADTYENIMGTVAAYVKDWK